MTSCPYWPDSATQSCRVRASWLILSHDASKLDCQQLPSPSVRKHLFQNRKPCRLPVHVGINERAT